MHKADIVDDLRALGDMAYGVHRITCLEAVSEIERLRERLSSSINHASALSRIIEDVAILREVRPQPNAPHLAEMAATAQRQAWESEARHVVEIKRLEAMSERLRAECERLRNQLNAASEYPPDGYVGDTPYWKGPSKDE